MMKKKVMPLSCLMAAAMLAGCGTAAPAVPEETTAPAVETAEAAQETAPADAAESEAAAVEKTAGVWQVEPCYNFDEIVPLYSEWDHTAGKNAADGLYAVRDGERWSLFSTKTGNIMMQDAAQQMPYLYGTNELSVWLDDEYYNYDNFAAMREKCEGLNAELQANGAEIEVLYDGVGGYANRWIYTEDGQIYYDLLGTYEFSGTPLVQVSDASALFGVRPATWDNEYRCYTVANGAPYAVARSDGSLLSSFRYKNVCMAGDELIAVEDTDGNWGYCDINGEEVIPCTYQAAMQAEGASEPIALRHNIPQFPLVFIIGIAGNADEFDAVGVGQGSIKIPAVLQNQRLSGGSFFYVQLAARDLPDLFAVQPGGHQTLAGALVQVVHLFLRLGKGKADLLGGQVGGVAVQRIHHPGHKTIRCGAAGLRCRTDLPLQSLLVGICVDVRLLQKAQIHAALVQRFVQGTALVGAAAHAGDAVKHDGIPFLHNAQQLVQFPAALAGCAGVDLPHDMGRWVGSGNVADLALDILLRRGNAAVSIDKHSYHL